MDIQAFLKALPEAATSPYAFAAYVVAAAAWVLNNWLTARPQKKAKEILDGVQDDRNKIELIEQLMQTSPPRGLERKDILEWVRLQSKAKNKIYLLIAYLATLLALLVIVVVALARPDGRNGPRSVTMRIVPRGGGMDCMPLPASARLVVRVGPEEPEDLRIENCSANIPIRPEWKRNASARLELRGASGWVLAQPNAAYGLDTGIWIVEIQAAANSPRLLIQLFEYAGTGAGTDNQESFRQFQTIIRNKLQILSEALASRSASCKYLGDLRVVQAKQGYATSPNETLEQWRSTNALMFLSGVLFRKDTALYVRSQPFLGELAGPLSARQVQLDLKIDENEFTQVVDSHSLALLYALAMDARRIGLPNDVVMIYLGEAVSVARGIDASLGGVAHLKTAVREVLQQLGVPAPEEI